MTTKTGITSNVDIFPTIEEVLQPNMATQCTLCSKQFLNWSSCRMHRIKVHKIFDTNDQNERRISNRTDGQKVARTFHCPQQGCSRKFESLSMLRQHFQRVHTEKKFVCECDYKTALEKDFKYHKKMRCPKRIRDNGTNKDNNGNVTLQPMPMVLRNSEGKLYKLVPIGDQNELLDNFSRKSTCEIGVQTQVMVETQEAQSTSYMATEEVGIMTNMEIDYSHRGGYEQPINLCSRSTEIDDGVLGIPDYYGAPHSYQAGHFLNKPPDYQDFGASTSDLHQPETRSFGTGTAPFSCEEVSTRHVSTSMNDEDYFEIFKNSETQTPRYFAPSESGAENGDESQNPWNWIG